MIRETQVGEEVASFCMLDDGVHVIQSTFPSSRTADVSVGVWLNFSWILAHPLGTSAFEI